MARGKKRQRDGISQVKEAIKTYWLIILFQYRISPWPKTAEKRGFCTCVTDGHTDGRSDGRTNGRTDGRTDRPSYRDAFLTDASKKRERKIEHDKRRRRTSLFKLLNAFFGGAFIAISGLLNC